MKQNFVDKAFSYFSPKFAFERARFRFMAGSIDSAYDGASLSDKTMQRWQVTKGSANADYSESTQDTLISRCRDAYRNQALARAIVDRLKHNAVGTGLRLQARPDWKRLGIEKELGKELEHNIESDFDVFADSQDVDIERTNNFYAQQNLVLVSALISGDVFVNTPSVIRAGKPFELTLQVIEADRITNPNLTADTQTLARGVEKDKFGAPVAYHVLSQHPGDEIVMGMEWDRIPVFGKATGRRRVLHVFEKERSQLSRGIPYLAPILKPLRQLDRYTDAELTAAVVSSLLTVFIKTEGNFSLPNYTASTTEPDKTDQIALGTGAIINLKSNESIETVNPMRPNSNYDPFVQAVLRQIGAATNIPLEVMQLYFSSSYSAAKGAILQFWKLVLYIRKLLMIDQFCQPIYGLWFDEAVATGRIPAKNYADPFVRAAWTRANWVGPSRGALDENKEIVAAKDRIALGVSTRQKEAEELSQADWLDLHNQLAEEKRMRVEDGLEEPTKPDTMSGSEVILQQEAQQKKEETANAEKI